MKPYAYVPGMESLNNLAGHLMETDDEKRNKLKRKLEHLVSKEHDVKVELEYAEQLLMKKPRKEVENWLKEVGRIKNEVQNLEARVKERSIFDHLTLRNSIDRHTTEVNQLIQRGVFHGGLTLQVCDSGVPMDNIANALGLGFLDEKDERKRAAVLASVLRKKKNFVLILDDIWDPIKLDEVGIPANEIGCKLIITTRSLDVCRMMNCKEIIKVEPLSENDAWELFLFHMHLEHSATFPSDIEEVAKPLVNEFAGLPLGIILAAGCVRGVDDICQWNDALEQMKNPSLGQDELEFGKLFQVMKYSFDKLDPAFQQCFLYCALYPEDYEIYREGLIQHFIDEKLIHEMNTRRAELNRGHTILNKLENSCLLERRFRFGRKYVKMHDVVRDMAIKIASMNSPRFLVGVEAIDKLEDVKLMEDTVRMSLLVSDFNPYRTPHASPRCASLSTMLCFNVPSISIPDCFFTHMNRLTILDLSHSSIYKLPTSVYKLQCLTSLVLRHCFFLEYVSSLENLKALRRLDLFSSGLRELPQGIDTLTNLRYLDLACPIEVRLDGILWKLSNLQYLALGTEEFTIRAEEIASLRKLETLRTYFRDLNEYNACVNSWKDGGPTDNYLTFGNNVDLKEDDASASIGGERSVILPNHMESLGIEMLDNVDLVTFFCDQRAFDLRQLVIKSCGRIKQLLPCSSFSVPAFQILETLYLRDLRNLSDLVEVKRSASSALHTATFSCLKKITIDSCNNIKRLFTLALLCNLQNLRILQVEKCYKMVEIIEPSDELDPQETSSSISSTLPNLSHLVLHKLPKLMIFCSNTKMDFPSLKHIKIEECPKLKRFPPLPPVPPSKQVAGTTITMPKLKRFPPLPPLGSSKDVAGSTSTIISLEGVEMDEKKGQNDCLCN
ncbi:hypothetical protein FNV43_RR21052 [Rhamnella rubrinervis]|uniref:NB-ARC domain-containing protein n=1 Tax=Rhamnella rubrinervis TaxID=2594499 RepID=A0A8K0DVY4_9ROSA|nr:hypothetical protein FNV43_RR21052 [Rhamnella rubrinervis]